MEKVEHISKERDYLENLTNGGGAFMDEYEKECLRQVEALEEISKLEGYLGEDAHRLLSIREDEDFKYKPTDVLKIIETMSKEVM